MSDLASVRDFHQEVLGSRWSDMVGDLFVFMRRNADHHTIDERPARLQQRPWHETTPLRPRLSDPTEDAANPWGPQHPGVLEH